ncbi:MAG TPA: M48 family metallopeptidase [Terriglobales bacterium]|jgi:STE24 endopeptidase
MLANLRAVALVALFTVIASRGFPQGVDRNSAPQSPVSQSVPAPQSLDVNAAVSAYLAKVPPALRARSDAYFEGGYWLLLVDFLYGALVMWVLLHFGLSAGMRNLAERITRFRPVQHALYWLQFIVMTTLLTSPLTVYEGYFREHRYDLSNQSFGQWSRDQAVMLAIAIVFGAPLIMLLFAAVRRLGKTWWIWASLLTIAFLAFGNLIAPVYFFPLFNQYKPLGDPRVRDPILSMARAQGIPAKEVYEFDASRQSNRVSANVSGLAGTMRISLNDNLLNRCTLPEIETTMGHEMGHYVLNHAYKGLVMNGVLFVVAFAFLGWALNFSLVRWGEKWKVRGLTDPAVLPLAVLLLSLYFFVLTPVSNTVTRTMEFEADMYGINAAGQPDGEANVDLMLGEYRKLDPGPLEEFIFYDHPSGRTRITAAMRWKAEHPESANPEEMSRPLWPSK